MKYLVIFVTIISFSGFSQVNKDSLWHIWNNQTEADTNRLQAMFTLIHKGYIYTQPDTAFHLAQLQYDLAERTGNKMHMAHALNFQGTSLFFQGKQKKAIEYYERTLSLQKEIDHTAGVAATLNNLGAICKNTGEYDKAIKYFSESVDLYRNQKDSVGVATALGNMGIIYMSRGDFNQAIKHYSKARKIFEAKNDKIGIAASANSIGIIYQMQNDTIKAMQEFQKSLTVYGEIENNISITLPIDNIGILYKKRGDYANALKYFERSLKISQKLVYKRNEAYSLNEIGDIYALNGNYDKAMVFHEKSLAISEEVENKNGITRSLNSLSNNYLKLNQNQKALNYSLRSLEIANETGTVTEITGAAKNLWLIYKRLNQPEEALKMHELYIQMKDSVNSEESQKAVIQQQYKYEYEKQAALDSLTNLEKEKITQEKIEKQEALNAKQDAEIKQKRTQQYALFGGLALLLLFAGFIYQRLRLIRKQKYIIEEQKQHVEEKNKEITDSITYAKRLQEAILPPVRLVKEWLPESFILYKPKDIVAGDFYWMETVEDVIYFAAADCTGHGVPGAMVSVVCANALTKSLVEEGKRTPAEILDRTRELVIEQFQRGEEEIKDGMDISLCAFNNETGEIQWAGANNPLWIIRSDHEKVEEIKADKQPIGKYGEEKPFTNHSMTLGNGDSLYMFSDGYPDQFGGDKAKKYKSGKMKKFLLSICDKPMSEQKNILAEEFENWRGDIEQVDDVCIIGVRV